MSHIKLMQEVKAHPSPNYQNTSFIPDAVNTGDFCHVNADD